MDRKPIWDHQPAYDSAMRKLARAERCGTGTHFTADEVFAVAQKLSNFLIEYTKE